MSPADVLQIVAMAAAWGGSFLFLRMAAPEFGPVPLIAIRVTITALFLLPVVLARPAWRRELRANMGRLCVLGVMNAAIPFPLFAYATLYVTAGVASIMNATAPLFAALVAWLWLGDRMTPAGIVGLMLGVAGVVWLVGGLPAVGPDALVAVGGALFASLLYGISASFVKRRFGRVNAWVTTAGSFGVAAVVLGPLAVVQWPGVPPSARAWTAVLLLAIVCTAVPNIYYFRMVLKVGPGRAMTTAFLIPVFGMLWGWLVLGEGVTLTMLGGCAVILLGTALVTGLIGRRRASALPASPP